MRTTGEEEVELKLELTAEAADALAAADILPGEPERISQRTTYFDTSDHDLAGAGVSLRVRRNGDLRVQTIKAYGAAAAGVFIRCEWEREVKDDWPAIDNSTPIPALIGNKVAAIAPLFTVENERRLWTSGGIEIALDRARVIASERETAMHEVELEQKNGDTARLFTPARRIHSVAPVHLGVLSKVERGYRLLGPARRAARADPIALTPTMNAADSFQEIAHACLRHFRLNVPPILDIQDARALHQARVAIRRLRSALSIYKRMLGDGRARALNGELRWLGGELGEARDLDVLIERARDSALRDRLLSARMDAYANAMDALRSARARALLIDTAEWIGAGDWLTSPEGRDLRDLPTRDYAAEALGRFRRKVKKDGRYLETLDDETRHEIRKAAKKLRYATEFFAALYDRKRERRRHKRFITALENLQDQLGVLNDLATAPDMLRRLDLAGTPDAGLRSAPGDKTDLLEAAAEAHDVFIDARRFWR